jgi:hypothetical protein
MNYIGNNLKFRQFPVSNPVNNAPNITTTQSLQASSSKNAAIQDNTYSTQNSSQNYSFSSNEEPKMRDLPN